MSFGGWVALETGLRHPEVFGAAGGLQPAITGRQGALAERAAGALEAEGPQAIRLLTSTEDPFPGPTRRLSKKLRERRVSHRLVDLPGPHGYDFNRGTGAMELLRFCDRALIPRASRRLTRAAAGVAKSG